MFVYLHKNSEGFSDVMFNYKELKMALVMMSRGFIGHRVFGPRSRVAPQSRLLLLPVSKKSVAIYIHRTCWVNRSEFCMKC
jgi:hypothetical protein